MTARRRAIYRFLAILLSISSTLAVLEVFLRVVQWLNPGFNQIHLKRSRYQFTGHTYLYDPLLGWRNIPGSKGTTFGKTVTINSKGLRDREYSYDKVPGVPRILVLGDSFTWGYGVSGEEVFTEVLEAELQRQGTNYQVLNAGVTGWGTDQEYLYLITEGYKYSPDLVLLAFLLDNDPLNNVSPFQYHTWKPLFSNTQLELTNVPVPFPALAAGGQKIVRPSRLFNSSALCRFVVLRTLPKPKLLALMKSIGLVHIRCPPPAASLVDPVDLTVSIISKISEFCKRRQCPLVVMKFGSFARAGEFDFLVVDAKFQNKLLSQLPSVYYLDLDRKFAQENISARALLRGGKDNHWNAYAHRQTALILREFLQHEGLLVSEDSSALTR